MRSWEKIVDPDENRCALLPLSLSPPSLHQQRQPDVLTVHGRGLCLSRALGQHFARPNLFAVAQDVEHASGANVAGRFGAWLHSLLKSEEFRQLVVKSCLPPCSKTSAASNELAASRLHACPLLYICKNCKKVHPFGAANILHPGTSRQSLGNHDHLAPRGPSAPPKRPRGLGAISSPMLLRSDHVGARRFNGSSNRRSQ